MGNVSDRSITVCDQTRIFPTKDTKLQTELKRDKKQNIDPDFRINKNFIFYCACQHGNEKVAKLLLNEVNKNVQFEQVKHGESFHYTPLYAATFNNQEKIVKILLDTGEMNVNEKISCNVYDLNKIIIDGKQEKKDKDFRIRIEVSPFQLACAKGYHNVVRQFLEYNEKNDTTEKVVINEEINEEVEGPLSSKKHIILTPLLSACINGHAEVMELLVNNKEINEKINDKINGKTPLYYACEEGNDEVVKLLLNLKNIEVDVKCEAYTSSIYSYKKTPLYIACEKGNTEIVKLLLEKGANIDEGYSTDSLYTQSPLYIACKEGNDEVVNVLLEKGAKISRQTKNKAEETYNELNGYDDTTDAEYLKRFKVINHLSLKDPDYEPKIKINQPLLEQIITIGNWRTRTYFSFPLSPNIINIVLIQSLSEVSDKNIKIAKFLLDTCDKIDVNYENNAKESPIKVAEKKYMYLKETDKIKIKYKKLKDRLDDKNTIPIPLKNVQFETTPPP